VTPDEELTLLEEQVRRLKVEYDIFFGGGSKKPPADVEWRVQNLLKKFTDGHRLNFAQRFRFNTIQQRYALFSALWQQKLKIKEEGYRRPQDAMLGIQGLRTDEQHAAQEALSHHGEGNRPFTIHFSDPDSSAGQVETLYQALSEARKKSGDNTAGSLDSFRNFVKQKTAQLRKEYGCQAVEYSVETQNGQVKLKAKPKS
jgi:Zn-dependent oligopeptidase